MNRSALLLGVLVGVAATQTPTATAQTFCLTDEFTYEWTLTLDPATDFLTGSVFNISFTRDAVGSRGTTSSELRHVVLIAVDRLTGFWYAYNGRATPAGGGTYGYSATWTSSGGDSGTVTGVFAPGACPAPRAGAEVALRGPAALR